VVAQRLTGGKMNQIFDHVNGSFQNIWWLPEYGGYVIALVILLVICAIFTWLHSGGPHGDPVEHALNVDLLLICWPVARIIAITLTPEHFAGLFHTITIIAVVLINVLGWRATEKFCEYMDLKMGKWIMENQDKLGQTEGTLRPWYCRVGQWSKPLFV
jgi:hypothetical protein